jgi:hypothetical protein
MVFTLSYPRLPCTEKAAFLHYTAAFMFTRQEMVNRKIQGILNILSSSQAVKE